MSSAHGLHRAAGGFRARWRQAWADLPRLTCALSTCQEPAAGFVETILEGPKPICAKHIPEGRRRGYTIYTSPTETSSD